MAWRGIPLQGMLRPRCSTTEGQNIVKNIVKNTNALRGIVTLLIHLRNHERIQSYMILISTHLYPLLPHSHSQASAFLLRQRLIHRARHPSPLRHLQHLFPDARLVPSLDPGHHHLAVLHRNPSSFVADLTSACDI